MASQTTNTRTTVLILMIIVSVAMRIVTLEFQWLSNFTPIGAVALFGGTYFNDKWKAYAVVLASIFLSNIPINYFYFHKIMLFSVSDLWMYGCFALIIFAGTLIKKLTVYNVVLVAILPVLIHWLVMDLPWITGYPTTLTGYGASLVAAIPFEKNMLFGDLLFGAILFGGFELAKNKYTVLQGKRQLAL